MTYDGHDGFIFYIAETSFGITPIDPTWTRLLEVESVSGRGSMQEVKDIRRHGLRRRAGSPSGKREEDDLVFDVILTDDDKASNIYDVFLKDFDSGWDDPTVLTSYTFLIAEDATPADSENLEYYYGCTLNEVEVVISEGEPLKATLTFVRQTSLFTTIVQHLSGNVSIDCSGNTVVFDDTGNPDTITRTTGSWIDDGFLDGDYITVLNSTSNNGTYLVDTVTSATVLTLDIGESLAAETNTTLTIVFDVVDFFIDCTGNTVVFVEGGGSADTITRVSGSWIVDGLVEGGKFTVLNSSSNEGTYTVDTLTATIITLIVADDLVDETNTTELLLTFDTLTTYMAYPAITYLTWKDVTVAKVAASGWTNTGDIENVSEITINVNQGAEKKFRLNQSDECVGLHMGTFEVTGSITFDYDNQDEVDEIRNQTWGNITVNITPTAGQMGEILLTDVSYDGYPFDSAVNSLITSDVDFTADEVAFGD